MCTQRWKYWEEPVEPVGRWGHPERWGKWIEYLHEYGIYINWLTYDWLIRRWIKRESPLRAESLASWYGRSFLLSRALANISEGPTFWLWHLSALLGFPGCLIHSARNNPGVQQGMLGCLLSDHGFIYLVYKLGKKKILASKVSKTDAEERISSQKPLGGTCTRCICVLAVGSAARGPGALPIADMRWKARRQMGPNFTCTQPPRGLVLHGQVCPFAPSFANLHMAEPVC